MMFTHLDGANRILPQEIGARFSRISMAVDGLATQGAYVTKSRKCNTTCNTIWLYKILHTSTL